MKHKDLEYLLINNPHKTKNIYQKSIASYLPDIHLHFLKNNNINYNFKPAKHRYMRAIELLRVDGSHVQTITPPRYPTNSNIGINIVRDKMKTEKYLKYFKIKTPNSHIFNKDESKLAKSFYFSDSDNQVVIKPLHGSNGNGVNVNVSQSDFDNAWEDAKNFLYGSKSIMVQEYLEGFEARATIVEGQLISITVRIPPYVQGDGISTIDKLIDYKNEDRERCGSLSKIKIKKNHKLISHLKNDGKSLNYIPDNKEYVLLSSISNIGNGGELMNITDRVNPLIKDLALNTLAVFPGLFTGGLDLIMTSFDDTNPTILEVNAYPGLASTVVPTYGPVSDPAKVYFETVLSFDQYINKPLYQYEIPDSEKYIENYLKYIQRKTSLFNESSISKLFNI